jgi:hypothetical protein
MAIFSLFFTVPIFGYALVQASLDFERRKWAMMIWGILVAAISGWGIVEVFLRPGY